MKITTIRGVARSALLLLAACDGAAEGSGSSSDVSTLDAELTSAAQSADSARSVASACFTTFEACVSAAGADTASCKSELRACLPDAPPAPSCGSASAHESDGGVHTRAARGDAGADHDADRDRTARGPRCRAPRLEDGALGKCRDAAAASADPGAAQASHARCVEHAFADRIGALCKKAEALCAEPSAPSDVCARVTAACSASSADASI